MQKAPNRLDYIAFDAGTGTYFGQKVSTLGVVEKGVLTPVELPEGVRLSHSGGLACEGAQGAIYVLDKPHHTRGCTNLRGFNRTGAQVAAVNLSTPIPYYSELHVVAIEAGNTNYLEWLKKVKSLSASSGEGGGVSIEVELDPDAEINHPVVEVFVEIRKANGLRETTYQGLGRATALRVPSSGATGGTARHAVVDEQID
jgi:hypothetical protein